MSEDKRLQNIFDSASDLFINKGFEQTKMKDVAYNAGVSVGSMYDLFKSKNALLDFIFSATLDQSTLSTSHDFPIDTQEPDSLIKQIEHTYVSETQTINKHLLSNKTYGLEQVVKDLFVTFNKYGRYFLILEKNPELNSKLIALYKEYRNELYDNLGKYLKAASESNQLRKIDNPNYDAVIIIDLIFWWSTHKRYDSFESSKNNYSVEDVKKSVVALVTHGYQK